MNFRKEFEKLVASPVEEQLEFFLKRYILVLGESWRDVTTLADKFNTYVESHNVDALNHTQAADFLQKNGKTRTAQERKMELKDIDLDNNGLIVFIEYLLLHYKVMVLRDFFEKKGKSIPREIDLSKDGVGVTGVGHYILEALFTFGKDTDPKIEAAIEEVMGVRRHREKEMRGLTNVIKDTSKSQVVRMRAQHELIRIENEDTSSADEALIHLLAGRRRVKRNAYKAKAENEKALKQEKETKMEIERNRRKASRNALVNKANNFSENAKVDNSQFVGNAGNRASIQALRGHNGRNLYSAAARKNI
eukprot:maker-scaffold_16-snap-gene-6.21-mRNA-1 protein AED:0.01 eAED:0.01 QI:124/1/1/1/1/1/2/502/305